ncbi:MAG: JAB domain-containing protein [Metallibacterium scheffleri]
MRTATIRTSPTRTATSRVKLEGLTSGQQVKSEDAALYQHRDPEEMTDTQAQHEADILAEAEAILHRRWTRQGTLSDPKASRDWLRLHCASMEAEIFGVIFLDNKHRVLQTRELFRGTLDGCSVPPREVVRAVIACNAAAVILYHNHPSGISEPSSADVGLTQVLKQALDLVGCRVLDHLVAGETITSLAARGLC